MIRLVANLDDRWCRSLPAGSCFLNPGGAHNIPVQADSDLSVTLLELACPQVKKLACASMLSYYWLTRNGARLCIPDLGCIFSYCSITGEFSGASHVQDSLARPSGRIGIEVT